MCKGCERINGRVKYLASLQTLPLVLSEELERIYSLWDLQRQMGLEPPNWNLQSKADNEDLGTQISRMQNKLELIPPAIVEVLGLSSPFVTVSRARLYYWATCELDKNTSPDYYLEDVYDALKTQFRPVIGINTSTHLPLYDDTYMPVLNYILDRFYKFESEYEGAS